MAVYHLTEDLPPSQRLRRRAWIWVFAASSAAAAVVHNSHAAWAATAFFWCVVLALISGAAWASLQLWIRRRSEVSLIVTRRHVTLCTFGRPKVSLERAEVTGFTEKDGRITRILSKNPYRSVLVPIDLEGEPDLRSELVAMGLNPRPSYGRPRLWWIAELLMAVGVLGFASGRGSELRIVGEVALLSCLGCVEYVAMRVRR